MQHRLHLIFICVRLKIFTGDQAHNLQWFSISVFNTGTQEVFDCSVFLWRPITLYCRMSSYCQVCAESVTASLVCIIYGEGRHGVCCEGVWGVWGPHMYGSVLGAKLQVSVTRRLPSHPASRVSSQDGLLQILDLFNEHGDWRYPWLEGTHHWILDTI